MTGNNISVIDKAREQMHRTPLTVQALISLSCGVLPLVVFYQGWIKDDRQARDQALTQALTQSQAIMAMGEQMKDIRSILNDIRPRIDAQGQTLVVLQRDVAIQGRDQDRMREERDRTNQNFIASLRALQEKTDRLALSRPQLNQNSPMGDDTPNPTTFRTVPLIWRQDDNP